MHLQGAFAPGSSGRHSRGRPAHAGGCRVLPGAWAQQSGQGSRGPAPRELTRTSTSGAGDHTCVRASRARWPRGACGERLRVSTGSCGLVSAAGPQRPLAFELSRGAGGCRQPCGARGGGPGLRFTCRLFLCGSFDDPPGLRALPPSYARLLRAPWPCRSQRPGPFPAPLFSLGPSWFMARAGGRARTGIWTWVVGR